MAKPKEVVIANEDELFHFVDINTINSERITAPRYSYWKSVGRVFFKKKINWVMIGILFVILVMTIFVPMFIPYDATEYTLAGEAAKRLSPAAAIAYHKGDGSSPLKWILGSGEYGNSIFAGIWAGSRTSLSLSVICATINMTIGILLGAVWGYSKRLDSIFTFIYNIVANVPYILLISVLVYVIGAGFWSFVFALTVTGWLGIAYFFRTQVLIIRNREYNLASRCLGTPITRVVTRNILPFLTSVIVTLLATELPSYINSEVFLSYIGVGLSASTASLGRMISDAQGSFLSYPWAFWSPVAIASIITIVLYVLGQNLADASDPRTHR